MPTTTLKSRNPKKLQGKKYFHYQLTIDVRTAKVLKWYCLFGLSYSNWISTVRLDNERMPLSKFLPTLTKLGEVLASIPKDRPKEYYPDAKLKRQSESKRNRSHRTR